MNSAFRCGDTGRPIHIHMVCRVEWWVDASGFISSCITLNILILFQHVVSLFCDLLSVKSLNRRS